MKQSATAAVSSVCGDQGVPGPPSCAAGAVTSVGGPGELRLTAPSCAPLAVVVRMWGKGTTRAATGSHSSQE